MKATLSAFAASLAALLVSVSTLQAAQSAASLAGMWDGLVVANDVEVPFPFEIAAKGEGGIQGSFFNGERRITSTSGELSGDALTLHFDQYGTTLEAELQNGRLVGEYVRSRGSYPFRASRAAPETASPSSDAPSIDGTWIVTANSNKGESAWRFIARQQGAKVEATILRVDGDTGTLTGSYQDGRFLLSHFSGARPLRLEVTPKEDGRIALELNGETRLEGVRAGAPEAAKIGTPTDPSRHTRVKDPSEPFRFSFPDLKGRVVSNTDEKFRGKVVLVSISGSWCPNCHDEVPFLVDLYEKYHDEGFEIVSLSFEEASQLKDPKRLRAFINNYGIEYTVLLAGEPREAPEKIPQAVNLDAFPTTFLLGRDGRVREVHAGFPSPGSAQYYEQATRELTEEVEKLLAEPAPSE